MARSLATATLRCAARVHATVLDGRFLRIRCTDKRCPDVDYARATKQKAFHVYDLKREVENYTDFEPDERRQKEQ